MNRRRESPTARIKHDSRMRRNIEALFNPKHRLKSLLVNSWLNWYSIEYTGRSLTSVFRWFARHMHVSPAFLSWVKCVDFVFNVRRDFGQINDLFFLIHCVFHCECSSVEFWMEWKWSAKRDKKKKSFYKILKKKPTFPKKLKKCKPVIAKKRIEKTLWVLENNHGSIVSN